ncbi:dihydroneopterin aldolase, partial [Musa troglodytarum]
SGTRTPTPTPTPNPSIIASTSKESSTRKEDISLSHGSSGRQEEAFTHREIIYISSGPSMGEPDFVDKDKLILRGLQFHGFHGVKPEEKKLGQKFVVDVDAWLDLSNAGKSDDISDTVSYTDIYR